jgi:protease II
LIVPTLNITDTYYHLRWSQSSVLSTSYVFFTCQDELGLPRYVYRYEVPSLNVSALQLVYNASTSDGYYTVTVYATNDNEYTMINVYTDTDNSVLVLPTSTPLSTFELLYAHERDVRYDIEHYNGTFLIRTNTDGSGIHGVTHPNFHVVSVSVLNASYHNWFEVVGQPSGNHWIDLIESFHHYIAIWMWQDGLRFVYLKLHDHINGYYQNNTALIGVPMDATYVGEGVYSVYTHSVIHMICYAT